VNNGTMLNFGLAGQSTRSTFMKTPLMFGQNAHAKLRDIKGVAPPSLYSANGTGNMFSPQSGFNRNFALNKNTIGRNEFALSPVSGIEPNKNFIPRLNIHKQISLDQQD